MPRARRVKAKYLYYQVCCLSENTGEEELFDLLEWINSFALRPIENRALEVNGVRGRLERTMPVSNYGFYALSFMRMDELSDTYTMKNAAQAKHVDLDSDEYIGKRTTALYDPATHIFMIQNNRGGLSSMYIESFINQSDVCEEKCYLRPILSRATLDAMLRKGVDKIDIRFSNVRTCIPEQSDDFEKVVEAFKNLEGITAHIEVGLGSTRQPELNRETVSYFLHDIARNQHSISRARIALNDDQKGDLIDLFKNVEHDWIDYVLRPRGEIAFEEAANNMTEKYMLARRRLL